MGSRLPELQRTSRVLQIIQQINRQPRHWTRRALADFHEVSERQITKDLEIIRHGLRLDLQRAPGGGYYFQSLPTLPALAYSLPEALAIFLAAQAGRQMPGIPREDLSAAISRLTAIMPPELRPLLGAIDALPAAPADPHREAVLETLGQAIAARLRVDLAYTTASRDGVRTERKVDPYAVVPHGSSWYLIGWCHLRGGVRLFKIDRIERLELTSEHYTPDPTFDLAEFMTAGWGVTRGTQQPAEDVELLFSSVAGRWVAEERWHPSQTCAWLPDGRLQFRVRVPVTEEFARWVLRYGADCEVVRPAHLRDWLAAQARALQERYASPPSSAPIAAA